MRWLILLTLLAGCAMGTATQTPLRPPAGDTLRLVETVRSIGDGELAGSIDRYPINLETQMQLFLVYLGGDSATTWFDSVKTVSTTVPALSTGFEFDRGQHMRLRFLRDGRLQPYGRTMGFLANTQFMFPGSAVWLAGRADLKMGSVWSDTATLTGPQGQSTIVTRYEVIGDSVYEGLPVVVIGTRTAGSASISSGTIISGESKGTGRIYFAPSRGVIVHQVLATQGRGAHASR